MEKINLTSSNTNDLLQNFNVGIQISNSKYEVIGFENASSDSEIQQKDIALTLGTLLGNQISLSSTYNLIANQSLYSSNQSNLIAAIKTAISSYITNLYSDGLVVNNVVYSLQEVLASLQINLPNYVT
ncbi:hypothetical protein IKS57_02495 [bacterium]|nr:hypothetical protein [bacterium]